MHTFAVLTMIVDPGMVERLVATALASALGVGAGSYFGLKGALNGIKGNTRDTLKELQEHRRDTARYVGEVKLAIEQRGDQ